MPSCSLRRMLRATFLISSSAAISSGVADGRHHLGGDVDDDQTARVTFYADGFVLA